MEAVVLAAGEGKRMRPLTTTRPKVMLPVAGRPLLEHVLRAAAKAGVDRAHVVVHYRAEAVRAGLGDGSALGLELVYHEQGEPRGTGHALRAVTDRPSGGFLMLSGDTLVDAADLVRLQETVRSGRSALGAVQVADARAYGALEVDGDRLVAIHEKRDEPPSDLINSGTYAFTDAIWAHLDALKVSPRGELELTDAVTALAREEGVQVVPLATWRDVGRPWDLLSVNEEMLRAHSDEDPFWCIEGTVEAGVVLQGPVRIEAGAVVRSGTYIQGPVVIQRDARVGPMAYLRASTVVGAGCHVGAHTELKNSILFDASNVPHLNYVGDSILGAQVNLGAGTKVANLRHDKGPVPVWTGADEKSDSGRKKMGVVLGDGVKTGINVSLDCGTVAGAGALLAPGHAFRGHLAGDTLHLGGGKVRPLKPRRDPATS